MYKSPIDVITQGAQLVIENGIYKAIEQHNINVDKDELVKALQYDRNQYNKGFKDGAKEFLNRLLCLDHDRFSKVISFDVDDLNELIDEMIGEPQWTLR